MDNLPDNRRYSLTDIVERVLRSAMRWWPRHPGSGRALKPAEAHPLAFALYVTDFDRYGDQRAIEWFLENMLGIKPAGRNTLGYHRQGLYFVQAFWEIMREFRRNPATAHPALISPPTTLPYLRDEVLDRAEKIAVRRANQDNYDRRMRNRFGRRKMFPGQLEYEAAPPHVKPARIGQTGDGYGRRKGKKSLLTLNAAKDPKQEKEFEELAEFAFREDFLRRAKQVLPVRQYQVVERRAQHHKYTEIAAELEIDSNTARVHLHKACRNPKFERLVNEMLRKNKC